MMTRGTETNKKLIKLSRGELPFELCCDDQRKKYLDVGEMQYT